jgi:hypothetical protein
LLALSVNKKVAKLTTKSYLMQMQLPIFPTSTKLINNSIGVFEKDDFIYYLHNGSPIFCHGKDDLTHIAGLGL